LKPQQLLKPSHFLSSSRDLLKKWIIKHSGLTENQEPFMVKQNSNAQKDLIFVNLHITETITVPQNGSNKNKPK
jgi:hypothetical protein